ncbi:DNA helicase [Clostridium polyendosporum]|uniref:DNA 3'-5' helicase n=1 Tax=Clostridium polyendosporum TaxID=69208 RepID=A0A919S2K5_9CLOT|nr:ATP-dependent helicase [Clostridium polyendosporum]GIM30684.1 DNA helicase [Clostridium polyendosporum]
MVNLDSFQMKAVCCRDKNVLVVAPPGSGKTTVIINRLNYLINERKVNPDNIIVITFTRAAAQNMKNRFQKMSGSNKYPFFGTFHALFYKILKRHRGEIAMLDPSEGYKLIHKVLLQSLDEVGEEKVKEVLNNISLYKTGGFSPGEFRPSIPKNIFDECYKVYEKYKLSKECLDFDDLQLQCKKLFYEYQEILNRYRKLFKYILVDEFQDCDSLQIELLTLLNRHSSLFAVGDEDQCIYSFRGSKPEFMVRFDKVFETGKKQFLAYNYRSVKNIVEASKAIITNNNQRNDKEIRYWRQEEGLFRVVYPFNESQQTEYIIKKISEFKNSGFKYNENAVLYRTNMEARSIIDGLIRMKVPFKLLDKQYNFFEHFICQDIIAYLKLSIDPTDSNSFYRIINKPFRYVSKSSIEEVRGNFYKENVFEKLKNIEGFPPFQIKKFDDLKKDINFLNKISLSSAIQFILVDLGYLGHIREYCEKYKQSITEFEEIIEEFKVSSQEFKTIVSFLSHIDTVEENIKMSKFTPVENGVTLSTIHGVKGMEFKNVFIIDCNEEIIPHKNSIEEGIEEERRLFYVGVTRAINNLFIYAPKMLRGKFREPSRFIKEGRLESFQTFEDYGFNEEDEINHVSFGVGTVKQIKGEEIDIVFNDGLIRKFSLATLIDNNLVKRI